MKFGAFFLNQSPEMRPAEEVYARTVKRPARSICMKWPEMRPAEEVRRPALGFDSVWLAEHHFSSYGYCPNPLLMAVKLAERTKRARIGIGVMVVPFYHPLRLAEEIGMADQLTEGRLDLGVGRGYQPYEFNRFGVPIRGEFRTVQRVHGDRDPVPVGGGVGIRGEVLPVPNDLDFPRGPTEASSSLLARGKQPGQHDPERGAGLPHYLLGADGEFEEQ